MKKRRKRIAPVASTSDGSQSPSSNSTMRARTVIQNWEQSWINYYRRHAGDVGDANEEGLARTVAQPRQQDSGRHLAR
jgi:hypothetical protein